MLVVLPYKNRYLLLVADLGPWLVTDVK